MDTNLKILIIGAGPTGLTTALEFARHGTIPEIVEKRTEPSEISRAVGIMPESIEKLRSTGVGDTILKEGMAFKKIKIHRGNKLLMSLDFSKSLERKDGMTGLPQNRTETRMRQALEKLGTKVNYGCTVIDIETSDRQATFTFSDNKSQSYDWVIGADGIESTVRTKLGIPYLGYDLSEIWSIADVELKGGYDPELISAWIQEENKGDFILVLPIELNRVRIVSSTPDCLKSLPINLHIQKIRRTGTFKISIRQAETYLQGKVLLAGDAAHCHSPVGGRGMNLGIDDAVAAVRSILEEKTFGYTKKRHEIGARIMKQSEIARKTIKSNKFFAKAFTGIALKLVHHIGFLQRAFIREITRL